MASVGPTEAWRLVSVSVSEGFDLTLENQYHVGRKSRLTSLLTSVLSLFIQPLPVRQMSTSYEIPRTRQSVSRRFGPYQLAKSCASATVQMRASFGSSTPRIPTRPLRAPVRTTPSSKENKSQRSPLLFLQSSLQTSSTTLSILSAKPSESLE